MSVEAPQLPKMKLETSLNHISRTGQEVDHHFDRMDQERGRYFERMNQHFDEVIQVPRRDCRLETLLRQQAYLQNGDT